MNEKDNGELLIRRLMVEADRLHKDPDRAVKWAENRLAKNGEVREQAKEIGLPIALRAVLHDVRHDRLADLKYPSQTPKDCTRGAEVIAMRPIVSPGILLSQWIMEDGRALSEYCREELLAAAVKERDIASGHSANAIFYENLAEKTSGKVPVGKRLRDEDARSLWQRAVSEAKEFYQGTRA